MRCPGRTPPPASQMVKPAPSYVLWGTPDDYDKVVAFYAGKGGFKQTSGQNFEGNTEGELNVVLGDDWNRDGSRKSRPVRLDGAR